MTRKLLGIEWLLLNPAAFRDPFGTQQAHLRVLGVLALLLDLLVLFRVEMRYQSNIKLVFFVNAQHGLVFSLPVQLTEVV